MIHSTICFRAHRLTSAVIGTLVSSEYPGGSFCGGNGQNKKDENLA